MMSSFLDMSPEDGTELLMTVAKEILDRAHSIAQELDNLRQFIAQNEDIANALGVTIVFHMMSCDLKTLDITTDCQCIIGSREKLLDSLKDCCKVIMEK